MSSTHEAIAEKSCISPIGVHATGIHVSEAGVSADTATEQTAVAETAYRASNHRRGDIKSHVHGEIALVPRRAFRSRAAGIVSGRTIHRNDLAHRFVDLASNAIDHFQRFADVFPHRVGRQRIPHRAALFRVSDDDLVSAHLLKLQIGEEVGVLIESIAVKFEPMAGQFIEVNDRASGTTKEKSRSRGGTGEQSGAARGEQPECSAARDVAACVKHEEMREASSH